jgi:hypothetical protein
MDSVKKFLNEKISDPKTPLLHAALYGAGVGIPVGLLYNVARGRTPTPTMALISAALGASAGIAANELNRRFYSNEFDVWREQQQKKTDDLSLH